LLAIFHNLAANSYWFLPQTNKILNTTKQSSLFLIVLDFLCFFLIILSKFGSTKHDDFFITAQVYIFSSYDNAVAL